MTAISEPKVVITRDKISKSVISTALLVTGILRCEVGETDLMNTKLHLLKQAVKCAGGEACRHLTAQLASATQNHGVLTGVRRSFRR